MTATAAHWEEFQLTFFDRSFSHLPEFRTESFYDFPAQIAHRAWVIELLKERLGVKAIGKASVLDRVISPELALAEFGDEKVDRAASEISGEPTADLEPLGIGELMPSCFGLPGAFVPTSPECMRCPAIGRCTQVVTVMLNGLKRTTGTEDPEHERRKKQQRDRVNRHRAKKALAASIQSAATAAS